MLKDALEKPDLVLKRQADQRRELWERIKRESPKHAEFIKEMARVFGKPKKLIYESDLGN